MAGPRPGGRPGGSSGGASYKPDFKVTFGKPEITGINVKQSIEVRAIKGSHILPGAKIEILDGTTSLKKDTTDPSGIMTYEYTGTKGNDEQKIVLRFILTEGVEVKEKEESFSIPALDKENDPIISVKHFGKNGKYTFSVRVQPKKEWDVAIEEGNEARYDLGTDINGLLEFDALPFKERKRLYVIYIVGTKKKFQIRLDGPEKKKAKPVTIPCGSFNDKYRSIKKQLQDRKK